MHKYIKIIKYNMFSKFIRDCIRILRIRKNVEKLRSKIVVNLLEIIRFLVRKDSEEYQGVIHQVSFIKIHQENYQ